MEIRRTENARCVPPDMKKGSVVGILTLTGKYWVDKFQSRRYEVECKCGNVSFKPSVVIRDTQCCSKKKHPELRKKVNRKIFPIDAVRKKYLQKNVRNHTVKDIIQTGKGHVFVLTCNDCGRTLRRKKSFFIKGITGGCRCEELKQAKIKEREIREQKRQQRRKDHDGARYHKDIIGQKFGKLTVVEFIGMIPSKRGIRHSHYRCICDCGGEWTGKIGNLTSGSRKYCDREVSANNRKKAMSTNRKKRKRNPNFGHATKIRDTFYDEIRLFSRKVYKKYKGTCQACLTWHKKPHSHAHHIIPIHQNDKLKAVISNGILLCEHCHQQFHTEYGYTNFNPKDVWVFIKSVRRGK